MKLSHCLVGCALLACAGVAQAAVIPVVNGSFETVLPGAGDAYNGENWYTLENTAPWVYTQGPYPGYGVLHVGGLGGYFDAAADGNYVVNFDDASVFASSLTQTLVHTVVAGEQFTLGFYVAQTNSTHGALTAEIMVGANTIASSTFASTLGTGVWDYKTLTGTATTTGALKISFGGAVNVTPFTREPWLDNVTMSVGAVPEPASLGLLSLAGLAMLRRRR